MLDYLGYAFALVALLCLLGLVVGLPAHRDGWRAGLRQYGTAMLVMLLALGAFVYVLWF